MASTITLASGGTLKGTDVTSGTDQTGNDIVIQPGLGTGAGGSGKIYFKTGPTTSSDTAVTKMTMTNEGHIGINNDSPSKQFHIIQTSNNSAMRITSHLNNHSFNQYVTNDKKLWFHVAGSASNGGYLDGNFGIGQITFTGQHRNIMNTNINDSSIGLIVSSSGNYLNLDNSIDPLINESLPICTISNTDNDKKVFGVISDKEDNNSGREYASGIFVSVYGKNNTNEERMFINSVGEGSLWICNKNGTLQNGDYITSTTVPGYGGKQVTIEGALMNFTVAKITCDCDFSLTKIVKQKLKVTTNSDGTTTIDYDSSGNVQYVDDLDSEGNQQMVYKYETRFLASDGAQLADEEDYNARLANGESVYIACFVGCTYHCG